MSENTEIPTDIPPTDAPAPNPASDIPADAVHIDTDDFKCPNCGGTMVFNIKSQKFMCKACKTECDIKTVTDQIHEYDFSAYRQREQATVPFAGTAVATCNSCGAKIQFSEYQFASVCPMCSSTQISPEKQKAGLTPDGLVPFRIDKQDAQQKFRQWAKTRWFAPNSFKKKFGEGGLKGMYLPFWTYDAQAISNYTGLGGRNRMVRDRDGNTRVKVDWYPVSGVVQNSFDDIQVCASDKEARIQGILPYRTASETKPYSPQYLSGYYAEIYKVKADEGFNTARAIIDQQMRSMATAQIMMSFDAAQVTSLNTKCANVRYKYVLLPLYASVYGYAGKEYTYLINGETGVVTGGRPYSIPKIAAAVVAGLILLCVLYMATMGPTGSSDYYDGGGYQYNDSNNYDNYDNYDDYNDYDSQDSGGFIFE